MQKSPQYRKTPGNECHRPLPSRKPQNTLQTRLQTTHSTRWDRSPSANAAKKMHPKDFCREKPHNNLLGLPAIRALQVLEQVPRRSSGSALSKGLGTFKTDYTIRLKPDATIYVPWRAEVEKELQRMQKLGVISKVSEPTPWCARIAIFTKPSGKLRVCVDLKLLNENVMREVHPLPKVDSTLSQGQSVH